VKPRGRSLADRAEVVRRLVGERLLKRFVVTDRLGAGGYGTVYRAWDERLERPVAVKVVERPGDRRVLREAQAVARLNHPSVVTLYELGEENGRTYLVSELVDGHSLREFLLAGWLSDRDVAELGVDLCDALEHAHGRGVVHRDLKPENVILAGPGNGHPGRGDRVRFGRALLADFGVASVSGAAALTASREVIGTLAYMAPEQAEGLQPGPEADVYSLGLVLHECWSGRNPVARSTPAETARAIGAPQPPLAAARRDLPADLCALIDACLDPEAARRPAVEELRRGLRAAGPALDRSSPVPLPAEARAGQRGRSALPRTVALVTLVGACIGLVTWLGLAGAALALALLALPVPLLFGRAIEWPVPALAPTLGAVGLAAAFPALAGLVPGPRHAAAAALLGFAWLPAGEALLGLDGPLGGVGPAPPGWEKSVDLAASTLIEPLLAPEAVLAASAWAAAAALLALVLAAGPIVLRILGGLLWAAALISVHGLLPAWDSAAGEPATAAVVLVVAVAVGVRSAPALGAKLRPRRERAASVPAGSLP
jgi:hypothetical protein